MLELLVAVVALGLVIYCRPRDHHHRLKVAWQREQYARANRFYR